MACTTQPVANYAMAQCYNAGLTTIANFDLGSSLPPPVSPLKVAIGHFLNPHEFAYIDCNASDEEELFVMGTDAQHWADDLGQTLGEHAPAPR